MKKLVVLMVVMALALSITGCTKPAVDVPIADVLEGVKEAIKADLLASGNFTEEDLKDDLPGLIEANMLEEDLMLYVSDPALFDQDLISEGYILAPMFNVMSDEIIVLKAKDESAVKDLQAALEQEQENRLKQWETYLPDQHEKVKNTIIKAEGQYLLYATWGDATIIEAVFDAALGK